MFGSELTWIDYVNFYLLMPLIGTVTISGHCFGFWNLMTAALLSFAVNNFQSFTRYLQPSTGSPLWLPLSLNGSKFGEQRRWHYSWLEFSNWSRILSFTWLWEVEQLFGPYLSWDCSRRSAHYLCLDLVMTSLDYKRCFQHRPSNVNRAQSILLAPQCW